VIPGAILSTDVGPNVTALTRATSDSQALPLVPSQEWLAPPMSSPTNGAAAPMQESTRRKPVKQWCHLEGDDNLCRSRAEWWGWDEQ